MDTVWSVIAFVAGVLYAGGPIVVTSGNDFRLARILVISSATVIGSWCFVWELLTDASMLIRVLVGLAIGGFVFVVTPETIRWMRGRQDAVTALGLGGSKITNENVTSTNQSGGITAHTVNSGSDIIKK